jgi:hypothetical protein
MAERKQIPKKLRFEVFKRDSFTCQYCGKMAPDVILELDHITPVAKGGVNNIMNLITSCKDCNRGKGAKELTDDQVIKQQQKQLKDLNEKREQLKLMLEWKNELQNFENEQVSIINNLLKKATGFSYNSFGENNCKKLIKKYGINEVITSTKISIEQYYDGTKESVDKVFNYIQRICINRYKNQQNPMFNKQRYIYAIIKNRLGVFNEKRLNFALKDLIVNQENFEIVKGIASYAKNWSDFWYELNTEYDTDY